jgi:hypothetical protein
MYKFSLDKSSKKFRCPSCHKKTFVKFIDNEANHYLNETDGRCDRENKCGYFKKPNDSEVIVSNSNTPLNVRAPSYHDKKLLSHFKHNRYQNNFINYLLNQFDNEDVYRALSKYVIGSTNYWDGATIFWQIDESNNIRGGKIMNYNCITGKRVKKPFNHISWIHKQLKMNDFNLNQCLFGLCNTSSITKGDTICVVESEKTAIIMSLKLPDFMWLATGSKTCFKESMLNPVKEYNIIAYPDKTEYQAWNKTASLLNKKGFNIQCSDLLEITDVEQGADLVDFMI